jgi:LysM repeat protein/ABC-type branched-subunit amino acid transport system substrate-binding protein
MKKFLFAFLILIHSISVSAQIDIPISNKIITIENAQYYVHTVESGQTLYSICKAYKANQKEVAEINNLQSSSLDAGQILNIPYTEIKTAKLSFYDHKVIEGETLFSLSKKYDISIQEIIRYNPEARYGIKIGEILKIPNKEATDESTSEFTYHTVIQGNTLFSIAQSYGIEIADIIKFNPGSENGIQTGQVLKIPKSKDVITNVVIVQTDSIQTDSNKYSHLYFEEEGITPCKDFVYDKSMSFEVALFLPLHLDKNIWYLGNYKEKKDKMFYKRTGKFIEMYEGILLAINELKSRGISFQIKVYDTQNKTSVLKEILDTKDFSKTDLIIGPVYSSNVKIAADYAKKHQINIISPLSQNSEIAENNPFVYQVMPSYETGIKNTCQLLKEFKDSTFLFIHNGTEDEKNLLNIYTEKLRESFLIKEDSQKINLKIVDYSKGGAESISNSLIAGRQNIVLIPSIDEVFVTQVFDNLYSVIDKYDIRIIGSPVWERFQNINFDQLQSLSFNYISSFYTDYTRNEVKNFLNEFRAIYKTEPSEFAFHGYDIMKFFGYSLRTYGRHFQFCLSLEDTLPDHTGLSFKFNFKRISENGGFENQGTFFLEYNDQFQLEESTVGVQTKTDILD